MRRLGRMAAALLFGGLAMAAGVARADNVVARWIQVGPGSSNPNATSVGEVTGSFGDDPLLLTASANTVLARAIVNNGVCPAMTLDHSVPVTMNVRFQGSTLADTAVYPATGKVPGTAGKTNGKTGYPQYFINSAATAGSMLPGPNNSMVPQATSSWTECEAIVPSGHVTATVGGVDLKLPVAHPKRILVMADTGCRMNGALATNGANQQDCETSAGFPLGFLASYEATFQPDLIVLVGDWFYRDTNCLTNGAETFAGCNTSGNAAFETWGDTFDSWNADVFYPAKTLLAAAPWVMIRGNHESCGRGARGWYALLDPKPYNINNVKCAFTSAYPAPGGTTQNPTATYQADFEPTYLVPLGNGVNLLAHDSSFANDSAVDVNTAKNYDIDLTAALASPKAKNATNIFATHKPAVSLTDLNTSMPANYGAVTTAIVGNGATTTVTFASNYTVPVGSAITITGVVPVAYNGTFTVTASSAGSVTFANTATGAVTTQGEIGPLPNPNVPSSNGDWTLQAVFHGGTYAGSAFANGTPASIGLLLSGHVHQLQYMNATSWFAPTFIVGTGGSLLDADMNTGNVSSGLGTTYIGANNTFTSQPVQGYSQVSTANNNWNFTVGTLPGPSYATPGTATVNFSHNYSLDEFGFAVLDAIDANNVTTGYIANTYKISSSKSGRCTITLGNGAGQSRLIACNF